MSLATVIGFFLPSGSGVTAATFTVPTGISIGQEMEAVVSVFNPSDAATLTPGTGWARQTSADLHQTANASAGDHYQVATFIKTYTGTPTIGATETVCTWTGAASVQTAGGVLSGQQSSPLDSGAGAPSTATTTTAATTVTHPGVTTTQANEIVLAILYDNQGKGFTTPSGWTALVTQINFAVFAKTFTSAGATGSQIFTCAGAADITCTYIANLATSLVPAANPSAAFFQFFGRSTGGGVGGTAQPGLQVVTTSGSYQLLDGLGNQFNAIGVTEYSIFDDHNFGGTSEWSAIDTTIAAEKAHGVNLVRQRILGSYYNSLSSVNKTAYITQIESRLAKAKAQGAILLLEPWDPYYLAASFATAYTSLYPLMADLQVAIGNDPSLIWGTGNEPNDASTGSLTWSLWQTAQEGIIANLVSAGYTGVILVDPINWANSGASGAGFNDAAYIAIETYHAGLLAAHHQIVFSAHQYWWPAWANNGTPIAWSLSRFLNTVLGGTTTHCILMSELGYDNDTSVVGAGINDTWQAAIVADLSKLALTMKNFAGIAGFAAAWNDDDNRIFVDSDHTTLTDWGNIYFAGQAPPAQTLTITNAQAVLQSDNETVIVSATLSSDLVNAILLDASGTKIGADQTPAPQGASGFSMPTVAPTAYTPGAVFTAPIFSDDFVTPVTAGNFIVANGPYAAKWTAYSGGDMDTSGVGTYEISNMSVSGSCLTLHLSTVGGVVQVAAPIPLIHSDGIVSNPATSNILNGQEYGRYDIAFKSDPGLTGFKTAWLLWPDSNVWNAEIDFPEGDLDGTITGGIHTTANPTGPASEVTFESNFEVTYTDSWHVATIEWTQSGVLLALDGAIVGFRTLDDGIPHESMHWVIQTETSLDGETPAPSTAGNVYIDWVAVYGYAGVLLPTPPAVAQMGTAVYEFNSPISVTLPNATSGRQMICLIEANGSNSTPCTVTGGPSGITWTKRASAYDTVNDGLVEIWVGSGYSTSASTVTVTVAGATTLNAYAQLAEISGSSGYDTGTGVGAVCTGAPMVKVTPNFSNDLMIAVACDIGFEVSYSNLTGGTEGTGTVNDGSFLGWGTVHAGAAGTPMLVTWFARNGGGQNPSDHTLICALGMKV